jgi:hypothetical protein
MNLEATLANDAPVPGGTAPKFSFASGARPLDGYTIKRGVGRGGFGEVYYATSDGGKEVALKVVRRNLDVELRGVQQCLNLKHPNLVGLYDIRVDDFENTWVVMEFVRGESLDAVLERNPNGLPVEHALWWIHGIGAGVAYLHDRGIVHRDLKPGNIFNDEGVVKIGDYGLSKFISASRRSGQTESVGTVHYMAPEIANGRYGKEIDIYALGVMLYEMLTGRVPFDGESVGEVLMKHLTAEPDLRPLAEPYRTVIGKALTKNPDDRYASVNELLAALPKPPPLQGAAVYVAPPPGQGAAEPASEKSPRDPAGPLGGPVPNPHLAMPIPVARPAPAIDEEPVWRAIRDVVRQLRQAWERANFSTPTKVVLILVAIVLLITFSNFWLPVAVACAIVYGVYWVIRAILIALSGSGRPTPLAPLPPAAASPPAPTSPFRPAGAAAPARAFQENKPQAGRRERAMPAMVLKTPRQKATELCGSLLLSAGVAAAMAVVITLLMGQPVGGYQVSQIEQFTWLSLLGIAGSWGVLIPAKFWEGTRGEPILRRFVLLCVGLAVGYIGYLVDSGLLVKLPSSMDIGPVASASYQSSLFAADGSPTLEGYLAYFGFLFPILRWWRMADPVRRTRFSLWSIGVCALWAFLLNMAWPFLQPWGILVAAIIAVSVQLGSPWVDHRQPAVRPAA